MNHLPKIICFGEILFDLFEDGAHLGGAPLNLAVHLHRLGAQVQLISAIGQDELGDKAIRQITREGLSTSCIALLPQPTGTVTIKLDEAKVPSYSFLSDCAYDFIPEPEIKLENPDLFCFGTLAQRGEVSRNTLIKLLKKMSCRIFCDVNLRQNFYSREILERSLNAADLVKLNEDELPVIASLFGIVPDCAILAERFCLETIILTLGPEGCEIHHLGRSFSSPACLTEIVSTVGAGDAFSAAFLYSMLSEEPMETAAMKGNRLAAEVASIPSAF
jgi:fructokinase